MLFGEIFSVNAGSKGRKGNMTEVIHNLNMYRVLTVVEVAVCLGIFWM